MVKDVMTLIALLEEEGKKEGKDSLRRLASAWDTFIKEGKWLLKSHK